MIHFYIQEISLMRQRNIKKYGREYMVHAVQAKMSRIRHKMEPAKCILSRLTSYHKVRSQDIYILLSS